MIWRNLSLRTPIDDTIDNWRANYSGDDDPEEYFSELKSALKDYREAFVGRETAIREISGALDKLEEVVEELRAEMPQEPDSDDFYGSNMSGGEHDESRSVFDDVDQ